MNAAVPSASRSAGGPIINSINNSAIYQRSHIALDSRKPTCCFLLKSTMCLHMSGPPQSPGPTVSTMVAMAIVTAIKGRFNGGIIL